MVDFKHIENYFLSLTINNTTFILSISLNSLFLYSLFKIKNFIKKTIYSIIFFYLTNLDNIFMIFATYFTL